MKTIENQDGIIWVEIPHQIRARAYAFADEESYLDWLRDSTSEQVSYFSWNESDWDNRKNDLIYEGQPSDDPSLKWWKEGEKLFKNGAKEIVEITAHFPVESGIYDAEAAPRERDIREEWLGHDYHAAYTLDYEAAMRIIDQKDRRTGHQAIESRTEIAKAAREIGWITDEDDTNE